MAPKYVLEYLNLTGVGEVTRWLLHQADVEFTDKRYLREDFNAIKHDKSQFPLSKMPVLRVDGRVICHSRAIESYLANKFNMYGANNHDKSIVDQIVETVRDFVMEYIANIHYSTASEEEKKKQREEYCKSDGMKLKLTFVQNTLKRNDGGQGYIVGESVTLADIYVAFFGSFIDAAVLKNYPLLENLKYKVENLPRIKAYLEGQSRQN